MSSATVQFPPLQGRTHVADEGGEISRDAHLQLLKLFNGFPLITLSTPSGPAAFSVPLAKFNQNVELVYVKISADANLPQLQRSGSDTINGVNFFNMGTAQYSKARLKSDGVSSWYVVG